MRCPNCQTDFIFNANRPLVVLGLPTLDGQIHQSILAQWNHLIRNYRAVTMVAENTYVDMARNRIVEEGIRLADQAYKSKPDYFLFIDSDTVVGSRKANGDGDTPARGDFIDQLIARNVPVISGYYVKKRDPYSQIPVFGRVNTQTYNLYQAPKNGLLEVDWIGGGYLLVKMEVFEKIPAPWFENRNNSLPGGRRELVGEDIYFCRKVKEYGFPIHVDLNVRVGHYGGIAWPAEETINPIERKAE